MVMMSPFTCRMCSSARIWSSVHHVQSCRASGGVSRLALLYILCYYSYVAETHTQKGGNDVTLEEIGLMLTALSVLLQLIALVYEIRSNRRKPKHKK